MTDHSQYQPKPCPVESGEECVMPDRRKWSAEFTINVPSVIAIIGLGVTLTGVLILNDRRQTVNEGEIKLLKVTDKSIIDHAQAVEQVAIRDRAEMRDDIKEIKATVNKIADTQRRR
jgi:hypothetical protein